MHGSIPVVLEGIMQCAQCTSVIEWREKHLVCHTCGLPVTDLCRLPAVPGIASERDEQQSSLIEGGFQMVGSLFVEGSAQGDDNGMFMLEENIEDSLFEWRVKTTNDYLICLTDLFCPLYSTLRHLHGRFARGKEGDQVTVEQLFITQIFFHKKSEPQCD